MASSEPHEVTCLPAMREATLAHLRQHGCGCYPYLRRFAAGRHRRRGAGEAHRRTRHCARLYSNLVCARRAGRGRRHDRVRRKSRATRRSANIAKAGYPGADQSPSRRVRGRYCRSSSRATTSDSSMAWTDAGRSQGVATIAAARRRADHRPISISQRGARKISRPALCTTSKQWLTSFAAEDGPHGDQHQDCRSSTYIPSRIAANLRSARSLRASRFPSRRSRGE